MLISDTIFGHPKKEDNYNFFRIVRGLVPTVSANGFLEITINKKSFDKNKQTYQSSKKTKKK